MKKVRIVVAWSHASSVIPTIGKFGEGIKVTSNVNGDIVIEFSIKDLSTMGQHIYYLLHHDHIRSMNID